MFNNHHHYHRLIRKYVSLFGNLFDSITKITYNHDTGAELERIKVPLQYGPKEKWVERLTGDPTLERKIDTTLPRMSFQIVGYAYDAQRPQNKLNKRSNISTANNVVVASAYQPVPYDISINLYIYARNIDDGNQIIEQILPVMTPDYTISADLIAELEITQDIPIVLNSITEDIQYEGGWESIRYIEWELSFTLKGYFYGPVTRPKIIRKAITNIYNDPSLQAGYISKMQMNGAGANGMYKIDDYVYQGDTLDTATAAGKVIMWQHTPKILFVGGIQGQFEANSIVHSVSTNASYNLLTFSPDAIKLASIEIVPNPIDADPDDDYGYTQVITEFPETL